MRSTHAKSIRCVVMIQSELQRHGEVWTYGEWQDTAAAVHRWGREEISRCWVRELREAYMAVTIRDLLSEMKTTSAPSDNAVASTTVAKPTPISTNDLCSSSSEGGDDNMILLTAEPLCRILNTPAKGDMSGVGGGRRK